MSNLLFQKSRTVNGLETAPNEEWSRMPKLVWELATMNNEDTNVMLIGIHECQQQDQNQ